MSPFLHFLLFLSLFSGCTSTPPKPEERIRSSWLIPYRRQWDREDSFKRYAILRIADHKRLKEQTLRFEVRPGDRSAQILTHEFVLPRQEKWYGMSFYLPTDFPKEHALATLAEWKNTTEATGEDLSMTPSVALRISDLELSIWVNGKKVYQNPQYLLGRWNDVVFKVNWSETFQGAIQVWLGGRQVLDFKGKLNANEKLGTLFKFGLAREEDQSKLTAYFNEVRQGSSREEVEPTPLPLH